MSKAHAWTRGRAAKTPTPSGEHDLVVVTNLLPVQATGPEAVWSDRADGLFSALRPALTGARSAAWVGWAGLGAEPTKSMIIDGTAVYPVALTKAEAAAHFFGHCAATLHPLYHDSGEAAEFRPAWEEAYRSVNARYSAQVARLAAPGATVWVHDYHLQLVPALLRASRPDLRIVFSLHSPFPPLERLLCLPGRDQVLTGILGADLICMPHDRPVKHLLEAVTLTTGMQVSGDRVTGSDGRPITVAVRPQSADILGIAELAADSRTGARADEIRAALREPRHLIVGAGPGGHADGIRHQLAAFERLLTAGDLAPEDTVLALVPTRDLPDAPGRQRIRADLDREVARINGIYSTVGRPVVHHQHSACDRAELVAFYLAADVLVTTPLHGGTNLRPEEFIAAGGSGRLVVSELNTSHAGLPDAISANPHDTAALADALRTACAAGPRERLAQRHRLGRLLPDPAPPLVAMPAVR